MNKLHVLLFCVFTIYCTAQEQSKKITDTEIKELGDQIKIDDTIFMKDGKLNIRKLEQIGKPSEASVPLDKGWQQTITYYYNEMLEDGTSLEVSGNEFSGYSKNIRKKNSPFEMIYGYYNSGKIKNSTNHYIKRFIKGISFVFNEEGIIESYKNYDEDFNFTWESVQRFLQNKKIKEEGIIEINRSSNDGIYIWVILYKPKELLNTDNAKALHLDGKTGEIVKEIIYDNAVYLD